MKRANDLGEFLFWLSAFAAGGFAGGVVFALVKLAAGPL